MTSDHPSFQAQQLLDALAGPSYVVDRTGRIVMIGHANWGNSISDSAVKVAPEDWVGRSLFDCMAGEQVVELYRKALHEVISGGQRVVAIDYRCDSPAMRRDIRLLMSPLAQTGADDLALLTSVTVAEEARPAIPLFDYAALSMAIREEAGIPLLTICSMCHNVKSAATPEDADRQEQKAGWISPEAYYQNGGASSVRISHGLCPTCSARWLQEVDTTVQ